MRNFHKRLSEFAHRLIPQRPCQFIGLGTVIFSFNTLLIGLGLLYNITIPICVGLIEIVIGSWLLKNGLCSAENNHYSTNNHATNRWYYNCIKCLIHRNYTQRIKGYTNDQRCHTNDTNNKTNNFTHNKPPTSKL